MNNSNKKFFPKTHLPTIALLIIIIFLGYFRLISDQYSVRWDIEQVHYTALKFISHEWHEHGSLPLWNPSQFAGFPIFADPQVAIWYPPHLLLVVLADPLNLQSMKWLLFGHLLLAGLGMYAYAWYRLKDQFVALVIAVIFVFSGFMVGHSSHLGMIESYSWLPILLFLLEKIFEEKKGWLVGPASLVASGIILAGHAQSSVIIFLFLGLFIFFQFWSNRPRAISLWHYVRIGGLVLTFLLLSLGLASIQILPSQELARNSIRANISIDAAQTESLDPRSLLTLLVPNIFGAVTQFEYWGPGNPGQQYLTIGLIPVFILVMLRTWRHLLPKNDQKRLLFFLGVGGFVTLYALGSFTFVQSVFYFFVPFFDKFRAPANVYGLATFSFSMVIGYGFCALKNLSREQKQRFEKYLPYLRQGLWLTALIALFLFGLEIGYFMAISHKPIDHGVFANIFSSLILFSGLFIGWFVILKKYLTQEKSPSFFINWSIALIIFELLTLTMNNKLVATSETISDKERFHPVQTFFMEKNVTGLQPFRVFTDNVSLFLPGHEVFLVEGYNPLMLRTFAEYIQASKVTVGYFQRVMNDFHVRYAYVKNAKETFGLQKWPFIERPDVVSNPEKSSFIWFAGSVQLLKKQHIQEKRGEILTTPYQSTAWLEPDDADVPLGEYKIGNNQWRLARFEPNQIDLSTKNEHDAFAVVSEVWYPGWEAYLDGQKIRLYPTNLLFRGVFIPAGNHALSLRFEPGILRTGRNIFLVSLLAVPIMTAVWWTIGKKRNVSIRSGRE